MFVIVVSSQLPDGSSVGPLDKPCLTDARSMHDTGAKASLKVSSVHVVVLPFEKGFVDFT
jgi:hypothetical protein